MHSEEIPRKSGQRNRNAAEYGQPSSLLVLPCNHGTVPGCRTDRVAAREGIAGRRHFGISRRLYEVRADPRAVSTHGQLDHAVDQVRDIHREDKTVTPFFADPPEYDKWQ